MPAELSGVVKGLCDLYGAAHSANQHGTFNVWVSDDWRLGGFNNPAEFNVTSSSAHGVGNRLKILYTQFPMRRGATINGLKQSVKEMWYVQIRNHFVYLHVKI